MCTYTYTCMYTYMYTIASPTASQVLMAALKHACCHCRKFALLANTETSETSRRHCCIEADHINLKLLAGIAALKLMITLT